MNSTRAINRRAEAAVCWLAAAELQQIAGYLAGPPEQFAGEVIGESSRAGQPT